MPRTAQEVIDTAIRENRKNEYLLYVFGVTSFVLGALIIAWSIYRGEPVAAIAGAIESSLFVPAIHLTKQTRRENMKLRMLELPLSSAKTADEAASAIIKLFAQEFSDNKGSDVSAKAQGE